jgi:hypothetical protein
LCQDFYVATEHQVPREDRHTPTARVRVPTSLWDAYDRVCKRLEVSRSEDLLAHIRQRVIEHGDDQDRADLAASEQELAERRARMHPGRPRKSL